MECIPPPKTTQDDELGRAGVAEDSVLQQPSLKKCDGIGGEPARPGSYRYVVSLELIEKSNKKFVCSGSLIASQFIMTAAHCVRESHGDYWAIAGVLNRTINEPTQQKRRVVEQIPHKNYFVRNNIPRNDVAVFIVYSPFIMNDYIQPINMEIAPTGNLFVFVTGWGTLKEHTPPGDVLRYATSKIMPRDECLKHIPELHDRSMCATPTHAESHGCLMNKSRHKDNETFRHVCCIQKIGPHYGMSDSQALEA
ncbi:coagulation factor IX-like [Schistocerca nitens]|uniref:coagulation factor IX-like n=1 Tax=Schistocerca nitens TaxID=7011 RepID=UPI002118015B|nr:coagulation factor IX-like [Schistocerca nitens]